MRARAVLLIAVAALAACGTTREQAHQATALDAATTAIGVGGGIATEANPLIGSPLAFAGVMAARVIGVELANQMDEPARTQTLTGLSSIWWGAGISNVMILLLASNPAGFAFGAMTGLGWWASTAERRLFARMCAAERVKNPKMQCTFRGEEM